MFFCPLCGSGSEKETWCPKHPDEPLIQEMSKEQFNKLFDAACEAEELFSLDELEEYAYKHKE